MQQTLVAGALAAAGSLLHTNAECCVTCWMALTALPFSDYYYVCLYNSAADIRAEA
jgi:hypothetical protein